MEDYAKFNHGVCLRAVTVPAPARQTSMSRAPGNNRASPQPPGHVAGGAAGCAVVPVAVSLAAARGGHFVK